MKPEEIEYVQYRMGRANECVDEARVLLESEHLNATVNRMYYACFYAVSALLLIEGLHSRKHTGIRSLFFRHWIKTHRLSKDTGAVYQSLFDARQEGDYTDMLTFEKPDVEAWFEETKGFLEDITTQVEQTLEGMD